MPQDTASVHAERTLRPRAGQDTTSTFIDKHTAGFLNGESISLRSRQPRQFGLVRLYKVCLQKTCQACPAG